jgi:BRCA1-associated protein
MYNGRPYHDTKDSEVAQVVPISSIQLKSSSNPPFTFPSTPQIEESQGKANDEVELPTCPICLERLDVNVSGLVQILCQHSYHCSCLLKWGDSR